MGIILFLLVMIFASYLIDTMLVRNYKIVKFSDGSYGLRRGYYWFTYMDMKSGANFWWSRSSVWIGDCKSSLEKVQAAKSRLVLGKEIEIIE